MKNIFITFIALILCTGLSAKGKNTEKEKEAIKKVISEVTEAYRARDFNKIAANYVQDETLVKTGAAMGGYGVNYGWKKISENYKNSFKNNPDPVTRKYKKVNFKIKVYTESAWSVHDEVFTDPQEKTYKQIITHFLKNTMDNGKLFTWEISGH